MQFNWMKTCGAVLSLGVATAGGCSSASVGGASPESRDHASLAAVAEPVYPVTRVTYADDESGVLTNLGPHKYSEFAEFLFANFALTSIQLTENGDVVGFSTPFALPDELMGQEETLFRWVKFDRRGRVIGYELAADDSTDGCTAKKLWLPGDPPTFVWVFSRKPAVCVSPKYCILTYTVDPDTGETTVSCDCIVEP